MNIENDDTEPNIQPVPPTPSEPFILPSTEVIRAHPLEVDRHHAIDIARRRGRAGFASLSFGLLIAGILIGYLGGVGAATRAAQDIPVVTETSTAIRSMTATATRTATVVKTRTETPPPVRATTTTTSTTTRPAPPRGQKTTRVTRVPASCLYAMDAAEQYLTLSERSGRNRKGYGNRVLREVKHNFEQLSRECRRQR